MPRTRLRVPIVVPPEDAEILPVSNMDYAPLQNPTESIRLLRIHPLEEHQTRGIVGFYQTLHCSMVEVKLCDKPEYDALSYTWGDPRTIFPDPRDEHPASRWRSRPFEIACDGRPLSVGCNLWLALLALRFVKSETVMRSKISTSDYIWIDAICINQSDLSERSSQVLQMSRIYGQARAVQVWLGGEDSLTDVGIQALHDLIQYFYELELSPAIMSRVDFRRIRRNVRGEQRDMSEQNWQGLMALLSRSWFKRAWICQEACLAATITFWVGGHIIPGSSLLGLLSLLVDSPFDYQIASQIPCPSTIPTDSQDKTFSSRTKEHAPRLHVSKDGGLIDFSTFGLICQYSTRYGDLRSTSRSSGRIPPHPLFEVLILCRGSLATDPRDKILAFLSLCSEYQPGRRLKKRLERLVDYNQTPADIYTETTRIILTSMRGDVTLLEYKEPFPTHDLPSWVPDFSVPWHGLQHIVTGSGNYDCSKGLNRRRVRFPTPLKLALEGMRVSKIQSLVQMEPLQDSLYNALSLLKQLPEKTRVTYPGQLGEETSWQPPFEVLWRTILGDYFEKQHPASAAVGSKVLSFLYEVWHTHAISLLIKALPDLLCLITQVNTGLGKYFAQECSGDGILKEELSKELDTIAKVYTVWRNLSCPGAQFADELMYPPELDILKFAVTVDIGSQKRVYIKGFSDQIVDYVFTGLHEFRPESDPFSDGFLKLFMLRRNSRQLGTTDNGHLGIFPASSQAGDSICVLAGARMPFVLRGVDNGSYRLLGDAYVHGIMHGEAIFKTATLEELHIS